MTMDATTYNAMVGRLYARCLQWPFDVLTGYEERCGECDGCAAAEQSTTK